MTIRNWNDESKFGIELNKLVSLSSPIYNKDLLFGREDDLKKIGRALMAPSRHIFIYGDRGVGKTSTAIIAAQNYAGDDGQMVHIGCASDSSFNEVCADIIHNALRRSKIESSSESTSFGVNLKLFQVARQSSYQEKSISSEIASVNDAVSFFVELAEVIERLVVVIDEFDKLEEGSRKLFADMIKLIGDQSVGLKFIFTGVASDIDDLLKGHASSIRQLETIELSKMHYDSRMKILESVANHFDVTVEWEVLVKASIVCDGYPYYVHLISERLMWLLFEADYEVDLIDLPHYQSALDSAIQNTLVQLKKPYNKAITIPTNDNEPVVWATADTDYIDRYLRDYYESYLSIMARLGEDSMDYKVFQSRIRDLKKSSRGAVLKSGIQRGLYTYNNKMLRGYVRMQAAANGIELYSDVAKDPKVPTAKAPGNAKTGYHGSQAPRGYKQSSW